MSSFISLLVFVLCASLVKCGNKQEDVYDRLNELNLLLWQINSTLTGVNSTLSQVDSLISGINATLPEEKKVVQEINTNRPVEDTAVEGYSVWQMVSNGFTKLYNSFQELFRKVVKKTEIRMETSFAGKSISDDTSITFHF